jgi:hypothetical protein
LADKKKLIMKVWFLAILLALIALAPVFLLTYYNIRQTPPDQVQQQPIASIQFEVDKPPQQLEVGASFNVLACKVIDGYRFEMYLDGGKWIEAHLPVATKDGAVPVVVEWLNKTTSLPPTVTLRRQVGNYWIVDFQLNVDGKRVNLIDCLKAKGLLL